MNKRGYYWIKTNTAYLSDTKYLKLSRIDRSFYFELYLLACEGDSGGVLVQNDEVLSVEDIAFLLHDTEENLQKSINTLIKVGLLQIENDGAYTITRFMDEQGKVSFGTDLDKKRAQWRDRQQKHRNKNNENSDKDSDIDKEIDIEVTKMSRVTFRDNENPISSLSSLKDNPKDISKDIEHVKQAIETKIGATIKAGSNWYKFIDFVIEREKINPKETIEAFFEHLDSTDYKYATYSGYNRFMELWPNAFPEEVNEPKNSFYAGCADYELDIVKNEWVHVGTKAEPEKKYVYMPKYTPKKTEEEDGLKNEPVNQPVNESKIEPKNESEDEMISIDDEFMQKCILRDKIDVKIVKIKENGLMEGFKQSAPQTGYGLDLSLSEIQNYFDFCDKFIKEHTVTK